MVRAGELREKIYVRRPLRVQDSSGNITTNYTGILDTFAKVEQKQANSQLVAEQDNIYGGFHFKMRFRPLVFLQVGDELIWRGIHFTINNFKIDPLRTQIEIFVDQKLENTNIG